ncbi:MAG: methylated-DNA--[protein]-cysteine S-methyltransferase [Gammaproteobacteria bacterium]|nr:methylated-DNA--[protein]-cysteine S-methyltransferase [Gammaproteobacteria bacterium]
MGMQTPVGPVEIVEDDGSIRLLRWSTARPNTQSAPSALLRRAQEQLRAYFAGELEVFDLPLHPLGEAFQQRVCAAMLEIPFGQTRTYGELAAQLATAAQPIGQACGDNSIPIIIPCHRVLGAKGLGGYSGSGGLETKITLLKHEHAYPYLL